jgi:hypothetical protein
MEGRINLTPTYESQKSEQLRLYNERYIKVLNDGVDSEEKSGKAPY